MRIGRRGGESKVVTGQLEAYSLKQSKHGYFQYAAIKRKYRAATIM